MATTSDGTPSPQRIKEAFEMLNEAVVLAIEDVKSRFPDEERLIRALDLAKQAEDHIHTDAVTRD